MTQRYLKPSPVSFLERVRSIEGYRQFGGGDGDDDVDESDVKRQKRLRQESDLRVAAAAAVASNKEGFGEQMVIANKLIIGPGLELVTPAKGHSIPGTIEQNLPQPFLMVLFSTSGKSGGTRRQHPHVR